MRGDYWQVCDGHDNQRQSDPVNESTLSTFSLGKKACVICFSLVMAVVCKDMQVCILLLTYTHTWCFLDMLWLWQAWAALVASWVVIPLGWEVRDERWDLRGDV